jgi:hypothetical protein
MSPLLFCNPLMLVFTVINLSTIVDKYVRPTVYNVHVQHKVFCFRFTLAFL